MPLVRGLCQAGYLQAAPGGATFAWHHLCCMSTRDKHFHVCADVWPVAQGARPLRPVWLGSHRVGPWLATSPSALEASGQACAGPVRGQGLTLTS